MDASWMQKLGLALLVAGAAQILSTLLMTATAPEHQQCEQG